MATVTIDEQTLKALQAAAKFVLDHADSIDHDTQFYARHLRIEAPSATPEAQSMTQEDADRLRKDLDTTLTALDAAGIDN